jgi:hypothetical protein
MFPSVSVRERVVIRVEYSRFCTSIIIDYSKVFISLMTYFGERCAAIDTNEKLDVLHFFLCSLQTKCSGVFRKMIYDLCMTVVH